MANVEFDLFHPYRKAKASEEFIGDADYGEFHEVIEPEVLKEFLLAREKAMADFDKAEGEEPKPLYYSTQSFIDALMSVPKALAISSKEYEDTCVEYRAMKEYCKHSRAELLTCGDRFARLVRERDALLSDLRNACCCKKCRHYLDQDDSNLCSDCWVETTPGRPELTGRTHWEWVGVKEGSTDE